MTIKSEIEKIETAKAAVKAAIAAGGGTVPIDASLADYAIAITSRYNDINNRLIEITGTNGGGNAYGNTKYGATGSTFLGEVDENGVLQLPTQTSNLVFSRVQDIDNYVLSGKFYNNDVPYNHIKTVVFPDLIRVTHERALNETFKKCDGITSVSFPVLREVTSIEGMRDTFHTCNGILTVELPALENVTNDYGMTYTFYHDNAMTTVNLNSLQNVSGYYAMQYAFAECRNLTKIEFPSLKNVSGEYAMTHTFYNDRNIQSVNLSALEDVTGRYALHYTFYQCQNNKRIDLSSLKNVSGNHGMCYTFHNNYALESIDLSSLEQVSGSSGLNSTFIYNRNLTHIELPKLTSITGSYGMANCFQENTGLLTADLSKLKTVKSYGLNDTFYGCTALTEIDVSSLEDINSSNALESFVSNCTSLTTIHWNPNIKEINGSYVLNYTFSNCTSLTSTDFMSLQLERLKGDHVINYTFNNCDNLVSANFPKLEEADYLNYMFSNCTKLTDVNFPVLEVGGDITDVFNGCTSLTHVEFPKLRSVWSLVGLFNGCTSLTSFSIPNIEYPGYIGYMFNNCKSIVNIDLKHFKQFGTMDYAFYGCTNLETVDLSELTTVNRSGSSNNASYAFYNCPKLSSVNLSKLYSLAEGSYAASYMFAFSSKNNGALESITFNSLRVINQANTFSYAFYRRTGIKHIYFPALNSNSFGTRKTQFNNMLADVTGCTVHFPVELESVISTWESYSNGFGGTDTIILFDLEKVTLNFNLTYNDQQITDYNIHYYISGESFDSIEPIQVTQGQRIDFVIDSPRYELYSDKIILNETTTLDIELTPRQYCELTLEILSDEDLQINNIEVSCTQDGKNIEAIIIDNNVILEVETGIPFTYDIYVDNHTPIMDSMTIPKDTLTYTKQIICYVDYDNDLLKSTSNITLSNFVLVPNENSYTLKSNIQNQDDAYAYAFVPIRVINGQIRIDASLQSETNYDFAAIIMGDVGETPSRLELAELASIRNSYSNNPVGNVEGFIEVQQRYREMGYTGTIYSVVSGTYSSIRTDKILSTPNTNRVLTFIYCKDSSQSTGTDTFTITKIKDRIGSSPVNFVIRDAIDKFESMQIGSKLYDRNNMEVYNNFIYLDISDFAYKSKTPIKLNLAEGYTADILYNDEYSLGTSTEGLFSIEENKFTYNGIDYYGSISQGTSNACLNYYIRKIEEPREFIYKTVMLPYGRDNFQSIRVGDVYYSADQFTYSGQQIEGIDSYSKAIPFPYDELTPIEVNLNEGYYVSIQPDYNESYIGNSTNIKISEGQYQLGDITEDKEFSILNLRVIPNQQ